MLWTDSDFSCNSTGERILCLRVAWGGGEGVGESYFVKANIEKFYFVKPYAQDVAYFVKRLVSAKKYR